MADPPLGRTAIADAAIHIADTENLTAISMRRVGASLGVSGMALYRYVADRADLLDAMAVRAAESSDLVANEPMSWRPTLEHLVGSIWTGFERHPWLLSLVLSPERLLDLTGADDTEMIFARLTDAGASEDQSFRVVLGLAGAALGIAAVVFGDSGDRRIDYARDAGTDPGPRTARFRALRLDAQTGRDVLRTTTQLLLDGLAEELEHHREES